MLVGTHLYEGDAAAMRRQQSAVEALGRLRGVEALNVQFRTPPWARPPGIETVTTLTQDSLGRAGPGGRRKPLTRELFDALARIAAARRHHYFAYINSDIVVLPALVDTIEREKRETYAISRLDVDREIDHSDASGEVILTSGVDMFVWSVAWWQRHRRRFRPYVVGDACWDNVYTSIMMCHSDGLILNRDRLIVHERHAARWRGDTATARYNGFMAALDGRYFSLWCEYWERLEQARARGASADDERALGEEVFVWRRSATGALRQVIRSARARLQFRRMGDPQVG